MTGFRACVSERGRQDAQLRPSRANAFGPSAAHLVAQIPRDSRVERTTELVVEVHFGRLSETRQSPREPTGFLNVVRQSTGEPVADRHERVRHAVGAT